MNRSQFVLAWSETSLLTRFALFLRCEMWVRVAVAVKSCCLILRHHKEWIAQDLAGKGGGFSQCVLSDAAWNVVALEKLRGSGITVVRQEENAITESNDNTLYASFCLSTNI